MESNWTVSRRFGRTLEIPSVGLKLIQRMLWKWHLRRLWPHNAAHGYVQGRSVRTALLPHVGCTYLLHLDLKEFFHSCAEDMVKRALERHGLSPWDNLVIRHNCLYRGRLAVGSPVSPALSNLCCECMDADLSIYGVYTRYSDQLIFSNLHPLPEGEIRRTIRFHGFRINESKSWMRARCHAPLEIMGYHIGEKALLRSRGKRRSERVRLHQARMREMVEGRSGFVGDGEGEAI